MNSYMSELGLATEKTMHPDKKVEPDAKSLVNIWRSIPFEEEFARQVDSFCNQIRNFLKIIWRG